MIKVELQDFEKYRSKLNRYALGLLITGGSGNILYSEHENVAKDIVQETYLRFHNHVNDAFVTEEHLFNFLKLCLYRSYLNSKNGKLNICRHNILKEKTSEQVKEEELPKSFIYEYQSKSDISKFIDTLTQDQASLLNKLLDGYTGVEIGKELGVTKQMISLRLTKIKEKYLEYESKN